MRSPTVSSLMNVFLNLMDRDLRPVMIQKVQRRLLRPLTEREHGARRWAEQRAEDHVAFCKAISAPLWDETNAYVDEFASHARHVLASLPELGGGGNYHLLYFLARHLGPTVALETGVAAGYSTHALLTAMAKNEAGKLWSSDFPYFRLAHPERFVGILVPEHLKRDRWTLSLEGDSVAVPQFLKVMGGIDLFHYDSDKTYAGRKQTIDSVLPHLSPRGVIIVDDIQDNFQFRDLVTPSNRDFRVFGFENKFCGLILPRGHDFTA